MNEVFDNPFESFIQNPYDSWGSWYGSGIFILGGDVDVWQHWGAFAGSSTNFRREVTDSGEPVVFVMFTNTRPDGDWQSIRESVISEAMMAVDYENTTPLDSDEQDFEWPEPLPPQDDEILGNSTLTITLLADATTLTYTHTTPPSIPPSTPAPPPPTTTATNKKKSIQFPGTVVCIG